jgi:chitosanase
VLAPATQLTRYLPFLPPHGSGTDMKQLAGLEDAWRKELRHGNTLIQACDEVADRLYYAPAMKAADKTGIASPVGRLIFYDTILQHGEGDDPDSFGAILARTAKAVGLPKDAGEPAYLARFLSERRSVLMDPANEDTAETWRQSVSRVEALENLLRHNPNLATPILVSSVDVNMEVS